MSLSNAEIMSSFVVVPDGELTSTFLATANVGSIFEDPETLIPEWNKRVVQKIKRLQPQFVALHCQEVGGKHFESNMSRVDDFVKNLIENGQEMGYARICAFFDKNYKAPDKFTALGSIYLVHKTVQYVELFNFHTKCFETPYGHHVHLGSIDAQPLVEKHKFPLCLFPDNRWSRKGFLRTRWRINGTILDLINIHLFHDASNLVSFETDPSIYVNFRKRALQYTLDLVQDDDKQSVPFIIFGDFNFRLEGKRVIEKLTREKSIVDNHEYLEENIASHRLENEIRQFRNQEDKLVLSIGRKEFFLSESYDFTFSTDWKEWSSLDTEVSHVSQRLTEFPINFPPTYPFEEKPSLPSRYMKTRCPAWCDRVLLSTPAKELIHSPSSSPPASPLRSPMASQGRKRVETSCVLYDIIGRNACMGDHKPVFLLFNLKSNVRIPIPRYSSYGIYDEVCFNANISSEKMKREEEFAWLEKEESLSSKQQEFEGPISTTVQTPVMVDHPILTEYIEIQDCNRVKLFKETTV